MNWKKWISVLPVVAVGAGLLAAGGRSANAADANKAQWASRCATRLSIAILGKSADPTLASNPDPQSTVDAMLQNPAFQERFARFVNAKFNSGPGATQTDDAVYYLAKYVVTNNKPWKDLFLGQYNVDLDASKNMAVTVDPNGLGYFRSLPWKRRYAGNESAGYTLPTAYRMVNNTTGTELIASTAVPGTDRTATGRQAPTCSPCHYDNWYALDHIAKVLTHRNGTGDTMTFDPPTEAPQKVLDGTMANNDKDVVTTLVNSEHFDFHTCRLAFQYLYGRNENQCEAPLFDKCVDTYRQTGTIQSAISVVAKDQGFCQ